MAVKYLVSGGEGALGKTVISMLLQRGEKVRILMSELSDTRIYRNNPNIEICYGISTDKDSMREFFELDDPRNAVLFHTDEYVSLSDSTNLTMRRVNVIGAENIVDMCLKRKVGKLVYLSSAYALNPEVSGDSITIHFDRNKVAGEYAKSKAEAAAYVMEKVALNRLNAVMVLPTFIIGPGYSQDYEINKVLNSYLNNGTIPPKGGGRAFVDVRDVANAMLTLADKGEPGAGYIVSGDYKTSDEFFKDVNDIQGIEAPVKTASKLVMSKSLAKLVDFYYKITHKENPREAYTLFSENPDARFEDNSKGILPETTISFKESLNDTIKGAQQGGIQAAAAAVPKSDKKSDGPQGRSEKKTSAEAMEARLKQTQAVASKSSSETKTPPRTPFARAAAAAEAKAAAEKQEENKSIIPQSTLKDPETETKPEPKANSETSFRFGSTPTKFTKAEVPLKSEPKAEPAKPVTPSAVPKSEPVKSIIPPLTPPAKEAEPKAAEEPKKEAPKTERPVSSGFPRAAATPSSGFPRAAATPSSAPKAEPAPAAAPVAKAAEPKAAEEPKKEEAPKTERPVSSGFPRAAATPSSAPAAPKTERPASSGFPRAAATPSSGFPRAAATPSSTPKAEPAAPAAAPVAKEAEPKVADAPKAEEAPRTGRPGSTGFPRAAATPSSGFPRAVATPSSGFPRAAATPSSTPKAEPAAPAAAPAVKAAEPKAAEEPKKEDVKKEEAPKTERPGSTGFPRAAATPSSGFTKPADALSSATAQKKEPTLGSGSFLGDDSKLGGSSLGGESSLGGSSLGGGSLGGGSLGGGSLGSGSLGGGSLGGSTLGGDPSLDGEPSLGGEGLLHSDSSKQSINYAFMSAQAEHNPFKPATSSEPSPFKSAQPAQASSGPFKSAQPAEQNPFKPIQSSASSSNTVPSGPINSAFKPAESAAPAPKQDPAFSKPQIASFSEADLSELEEDIDKFGIPSGPVVPPGIFAPPPKNGRD